MAVRRSTKNSRTKSEVTLQAPTVPAAPVHNYSLEAFLVYRKTHSASVGLSIPSLEPGLTKGLDGYGRGDRPVSPKYPLAGSLAFFTGSCILTGLICPRL
jgi:hypothetical protein